MSKLLNENGLLTAEAMRILKSAGKNVSCECPEHLLGILDSVLKFKEYQKTCINAKPQDKHVHDWLYSSSVNLEYILSNLIATLARIEGFVDEENNLTCEDEVG